MLRNLMIVAVALALTPTCGQVRAGSDEAPKAAGPAAWVGDLSPIEVQDWSHERAGHLLERAGFGGTPEEIERLSAMTPQEAVDYLVDCESIDNSHLHPFEHSRDAHGRGVFDMVKAPLHLEIRNALVYAARHGEALGVDVDRSNPDARLQSVADQGYFHVAASRYEMDRVVQWWAHRMVNTRRPLEEKMTLFWHGHFATGAKKVHDYRKMLLQNEMLRRNATSDFRTLLVAISQDPAMLVYLDNRSNVKGHPNENFAREILELFSMGVGNYTEEDIREGARALTGWTLDDQDELKFVVQPELHDTGEKTVMERTGNFDGEDLVDIILDQPVTARFITGKLHRFFVREDASPELIEQLAGVLRENNYAMKPFLKTIFLSRDFYSPDSYATQIKSPVHLMVSTYRRLGIAQIPGAPNFRWTAKTLGQEPGNPPNVAGWKGGRTWINPATLLERGNFVRRIFNPEQEPTNARVTYNFETRIGDRQAAMMTAAGMAARSRQGLAPRSEEGSGKDEESQAAGRTSRSTAMQYDGWDLYRAIAVGNRRARQLVPQIELTPATIDLARMIEEAGLSSTDEVVDHFLRRFLRVDLDANRRVSIDGYAQQRLGTGKIDLTGAELESALRDLAHLIMGLAEYQLA